MYISIIDHTGYIVGGLEACPTASASNMINNRHTSHNTYKTETQKKKYATAVQYSCKITDGTGYRALEEMWLRKVPTYYL
jgi:hypothetical protein